MSDDLCWSRQYGAAKGDIERSRRGGILSVLSTLSCKVVREVEHSISNDGYSLPRGGGVTCDGYSLPRDGGVTCDGYSLPRGGGVTCEEYSLPRGGGVTRGTSSSLDSGKATI